jgi:acetyl-CoA acetyltransferase
VPILAAAQGVEHGGGIPAFNESNFPTAHHRHAGEMLWQRAGVGPGDVQVAQFYENFTGPVLMAITEMGFCAPEEVANFVANGNIQWPDGGLPVNTSGGNIGEAYIHGFENINEAVRQVRGESTCQVDGVELSLSVSGPGFAPGSTVLFCRE